ncbi:MAG TPA: FeoA domain-containing protein, partial [Chloroflexia bacterium]|nr:FeoA domain-containing protein [Chloroflexia bacterium]
PGVPMVVLLISEVVEDETALLVYLGKMQIMPGAKLTVLEPDQETDELAVSLVPRSTGNKTEEKPARRVALAKDLASKIWVKKAS